MKEEKKASPISVLLGWGKPYHGKFIGSVVLAVLVLLVRWCLISVWRISSQ